MSRKKKKIAIKQNTTTILDKLVEQTFMLILSFIFTTALIGGSGYALFQFPTEMNSIRRDLLEFDTKANQLSAFNDMTETASTGWLTNVKEKEQVNFIITEIATNIHASDLDTVFVSNTLQWIPDALVKISIERGKVQGYQLVGDVEQNLQSNFVIEYDYWIKLLNEIDDLIRNWHKEDPSEKDARLANLQNSTLESMANLSEIQTNLSQIKSQNELEFKVLQQKTQELNTKLNIIYLKYFLAGLGIFLGLAVFIFLGIVAMKKYKISL